MPSRKTGSLDPTFDFDGIVITDLDSSAFGHDIAIQADGKIVVAGYKGYGDHDFAVVRYNSNGSLDPTFDTDGIVITAIGAYHEAAESMAIQSDGKIVVAGYSNNGTNDEFAIVRYNTNGSLDATFNGDGMVTTSIGIGGARAYSVGIQNDGKIVVCGKSIQVTYENFTVVRYNSDGTLDATFDTDGIVTTQIGAYYGIGSSVVIQDDGKIIVAGESYGPPNKFALARYNTDGSLDVTFDVDGILTTAVGNAQGESVALQDDGKIVVAGINAAGGFDPDFAVARYNSDGSLDLTFSSDGMVTADIGGYGDYCYDLAIQADGRIVVFGSDSAQFAMMRYKTDGTPDNTFGTGGLVTTLIADGNFGSAVAIQSDAKIVVAGSSDIGDHYAFALARYNAVNNAGTPENDLFEISFYPNPANKTLFVNVGDEMVTVQIHDQSGRKAFEQTNFSGAQSIDLSSLSNGIYLISFSTGYEVLTEPLIVK